MEEDGDHDDMGTNNDESVALVKNLLRVQSNIVPVPGGTEHFDIYLAKQIYPVLVPGLEELSREIDRLVNAQEGEIDESIKARFNPCIFLAEYLMRNNPNHGTQLEYTDLFVKHARIEKIRRFFTHRKTKIYKHFCIQPYQSNFTKRHIAEYLLSLDGFLQMNGQLVAEFPWEQFFTEYEHNDAVGFEELYEAMSKWAISPDNQKLGYDDFAAAESKTQVSDKVQELVTMTDKVV